MSRLALVSVVVLATQAVVCAADAPLADAAERAEWSTLERLLAAGANADLDGAQADGMTALHWASHHGSSKAVTALLAAGADPQIATRYAVRPLSIACRNGDAQVVRALLSAGADANARLPGGETPLMTAARTGSAEVVRALLDHGANPAETEANGQTALMWAASAGSIDTVTALLEAGAALDTASHQGFTALHFAARDGREAVVERLLKAGADPNRTMEPKRSGGRAPRAGMSALMLSVESGHFELALTLVDHGADPDSQASGYAPLHAVSWVRKANRGDDPSGDPEPRGSGAVSSLEFVRRLATAGADVNQRITSNTRGAKQLRHEGATPLLFAARTADLPLVELLVELGADPLIPNVDGCTPLMACAGVGVQAVDEEAGAEPEVLETLEYLVSCGAEVNTVDDNRETAMHGAAYRNFPRVVEWLAAHGADPGRWNHKNHSGWTPMRIAEGYRPGSFKPHPETQQAIRSALGRSSP